MATSRPQFIDNPFYLQKKKPWWWSGYNKKITPDANRPMFVMWSHVPRLGHGIRYHPAICSASRPSFHGQFNNIAGMPAAALDAKFYTPANYQWDASGNFQILDGTQTLEQKYDAHAERFAQQIADGLFADGLLRGLGSHHDGEYGGATTMGEVGTAQFLNAEAYRRFLPFMQDMRDATPRSLTLKTGPSSTRTLTLPKRDINKNASPSGDTAEDLAAVEAQGDGYRHLGVWNMRSDYGRADVYQFVRLVMSKLKAKCDAYTIPAGVTGAGTVVQLCYLKFVSLSLEQYGYAYVGSLGRSVAADVTPPSTHSAFVEQLGTFWNERGDPDAVSARYNATTIFQRRSDGAAMTLAAAMGDDPVLGSPVDGEVDFRTAWAPGLTENTSMSLRQQYAFRRLEAQAQNWAMYDAFVRATREFFPLCEFTNFDHVVVKEPADSSKVYNRVGGGIQSAQAQTWLDLQGPTLYPRNTGAGVTDIQNQVAGAVRQFDFDNLDEATAVCSTLRTDVPMAPFIHGVELESAIIAGTKSEWGGTPEFLGRLLRHQRDTYGHKVYWVYSGDLDLTYATLCEISEELAAG
jgi:hypothetical protein